MSLKVILIAMILVAAGAVGVFKFYLPQQIEEQKARTEYNRREQDKKLQRRPGQIEIDDDDPRLLAASNDARTRFPDFAAAFAKRSSAETFTAAVNLTTASKGTTMEWIVVDTIDSISISGVLKDEPAGVTGHHKDERVTMPLDKVADWIVQSLGGLRDGNFIANKRDEIHFSASSPE